MEVNTRTLREASHRLDAGSKKINRTLNEVEMIRAQLRDMSNIDEFRWVLKRNEQSIEDAYRAIDRIASVLEEISDKYDRTEDRICDRELMATKWIPRGGGYLHYPVIRFDVFRRIRKNRTNLMILRYINRLK